MNNITTRHSLKVCVLGESGVGKTSITTRWHRNQFNIHQDSTIGAAFSSKSYHLLGKDITVNMWDTAGQERYAPLCSMYYRGSNAIIFVFSLDPFQRSSSLNKINSLM